MLRTRVTPTPTESLLRWLAGWLALAVGVQALSVGAASVGAWHRHAPEPRIESKVMLLWRHATDSARPAALDAHARAHETGEAHEHPLDDASVLPAGNDNAAAGASALAAFIAAPAPRAAIATLAAGLHHVWISGARWVPATRTIAPPRRPPRD
jgi:hypothetical protein